MNANMLIVLICAIMANMASAIDLDKHWCSSCDDPHIHTCDNLYYDMQISGDNYVMFTDYNGVAVTAGFRQCNNNQATPTCNCAVKVKNGNADIFLDVCQIAPVPANMQFFFSNPPGVPAPVPANCDSKIVPGGQETNAVWWNTGGNAVNVGGKFLCAKSGQEYNTYYIRTITGNPNQDIYVRAMLHDSGISCIYIRPSEYSFNNAGGFCGNFNNNTNDDKFIWTQTGPNFGSPNEGFSQIAAMESNMANFWHLVDNPLAGLEYLDLDAQDCPCGSIQTNDTCSSLVSACLSNSIGITDFNYTDAVHNYEGKGRGGTTDNGAVPKVDQETATARCDQGMKNRKLDVAVANGLLPQAEFDALRRNCIFDIMFTNDDLWLLTNIQVGQNIALVTCATQPDPLCAELAVPAKCTYVDYGSLFPDGNYVPCASQTCPAK